MQRIDTPAIQMTAITRRKRPILQTLVGPGEEHVSLAGLPTGARSLISAKGHAGIYSGSLLPSSRGGKFPGILQCKKTSAFDDGRIRQATLLTFGVYSEMKNIILIDEDVDRFDSDDILWAMTSTVSVWFSSEVSVELACG